MQSTIPRWALRKGGNSKLNNFYGDSGIKNKGLNERSIKIAIKNSFEKVCGSFYL